MAVACCALPLQRSGFFGQPIQPTRVCVEYGEDPYGSTKETGLNLRPRSPRANDAGSSFDNTKRWTSAGALLTLLATGRPSTQNDPIPSQQEWEKAEREIKPLSPSAFKELPIAIVKKLEARGCTIPQVAQWPRPHNLIRGAFARNGQMDWAVLCSKEGKSNILVFWGGAARCPSELAPGEVRRWLQTVVGRGRIGYSWAISTVSKKDILLFHRALGGPKPPPIDHQGIDDAFVGKWSVIRYCYRGKWRALQGAD